MKLRTVFILPHVKVIESLRKGLLMASLLFMLLALWFIRDLSIMHEKLVSLNLHLQVLQGQIKGLHYVELPTKNDLRKVQKKVEGINKLLKGNKGEFTSLLYQLEQVVPGKVYLTSIRYKRSNSELALAANSTEPSELALFVRSLDLVPSISEVVSSKQKHSQRQGKESSVEIQVRLAD